ncbi:hypothetical protein NGR_b13060 (plasmid) [Sinorhizobium fredii NGR234]|uniref:Uncharacterized protein n=1 Tax=Sinorhizobium fredii (strain NBRC 101917 / NGR234) TaxID=394 RepID=C3KRP9_SINFN|nr:hypothetical protein NGR_b13060 [Sinorhizobium fredii NGR234]
MNSAHSALARTSILCCRSLVAPVTLGPSPEDFELGRLRLGDYSQRPPFTGGRRRRCYRHCTPDFMKMNFTFSRNVRIFVDVLKILSQSTKINYETGTASA